MGKHSSQREGQRYRLGEGAVANPYLPKAFTYLSIHPLVHPTNSPPVHSPANVSTLAHMHPFTCRHVSICSCMHASVYQCRHASIYPCMHASIYPRMHAFTHAGKQSSCHPSVHLTSRHFVPHLFSLCLPTHLPIIHLFSTIFLWTWVSVSPIHSSLSTLTCSPILPV